MPKRAPPLSAKSLAAVRPGDRPIELVDGYVPGLRVRVRPSGARTWSLNIRDSKGVRRRFNLGIGLGLGRHAGKLRRFAARLAREPIRQESDVWRGSGRKRLVMALGRLVNCWKLISLMGPAASGGAACRASRSCALFSAACSTSPDSISTREICN